MQEIIELVIFGLITLLLGTGLLWGVGWLLDLVGIIFRFVAGLIWSLLRFIIPIVIVGGVAYALFRFFQSRSDRGADSEAAPAAAPTTIDAEMAEAAEPTSDGQTAEATGDDSGDASDASDADGAEAGDETGDEEKS